MRRHALALLLALLQLPLLPALAAAPSATGPDADGAWTLAFDVSRDAAGRADAALQVEREDADGSASGSRELGNVDLPAGRSRFETSFLPAEGAGRYTVGLVLDGATADTVSFDVVDAGASRTFVFDVAEAPTYLNLTNDAVNDDGKLKAPGDAVITRATLSDANGVSELDGVRWSVEQAGVEVDGGLMTLAASAGATSASIEHRYDHTPIPAGLFTLRLRATKEGQTTAQATRTFAIKDAPPTFVSGAIPNVTPDEDVDLAPAIVLADKNGALGPGPLEARAYRASTRVEGAGFNTTLGAPTRLADAEGAARWSYPLALHVPARAAAGSYRVSLYANNTLLASLPYEVLALPTLRSATASIVDGRLAIAVNSSGEGILTARLTDGAGASTTTSADLPTSTLSLDAPRRGVALRWSVELRARSGGPVLAERNGTWSAPLDGPEVRLATVHARGRLPAVWSVSTDPWDATKARADIVFTRWDGAAEPALNASYANGKLRVDGPSSLAAGRYHARMVLTWANGSASEASWEFETGPWVELALGEPVVSGRNATLAVRNAGGVTVTRLVVEAQPAARVSLRIGNATLAGRDANGRALFTGFSLAPGAEAQLKVELPDGPRPAGRNVVAVRVLARVELA